ncbi:acetoacetate decarboxylase family protein [Rufibacter roseolus]|uniref:acetoacetate decarboxylase family protein n=1 Tax=Rufibacter roseolus TaxID=2817375 RepID=UPI001B30EA9C|nr:acetoacetate decarboxylase family protein [Rufibacter roseolus]
MTQHIHLVPAPWELTGNGVVWLYSIPKDFNLQHGFLADYQREAYHSRLGAVMLMDYETSGVGPYQELLYLPAIFKLGGKLTFSVSKIYVSTEASAFSGRANWGIPKEVAAFSFLNFQEGTRTVEVSTGNHPFFTAQVKPWGPKFPFTTKLFPWNRIVQQKQNQLLLTKPETHGNARFASTAKINSDARFFPPVHLLKPLATVRLSDFLMSFPVPEVIT